MTSDAGASHLYDSVAERWGQEIVSGTLPAGTRIVADEIATSSNVSRTVVREVVRVLESRGLVEVARRVGITVLPPERWSPFDPAVLRWRLAGPDRLDCLRSLSELRGAVEPLAAKLAAERATPEQCGILSGAVIGMTVTSRAANAEAYLSHDREFHRTLLLAAGNPMLVGMTDMVTAVLEGRTHHALMPSIANPEALRLHGAVAAAVQSRDGVTAEASMRAIVTESSVAIETIAADVP